jgi:hypothetical protein
MDKEFIVGLVALTMVVFIAVLVYFFVYKKSDTSSSVSSSETSPSYDEKGDLWLYDRWTSGSGYVPRSATYGSPINTNNMECDYCACPVNCDGTPRRIDPGCPAQTIQCVTQDCRVTSTCRRGT